VSTTLLVLLCSSVSMLCVFHSFPTRRSSDLLLFLTCQYNAGLCTSSLVASALVDSPSRPCSVTSSHAAVTILSTVSWMFLSVDLDRKSTRLNSSHVKISYAVFCLKKKRKILL